MPTVRECPDLQCSNHGRSHRPPPRRRRPLSFTIDKLLIGTHSVRWQYLLLSLLTACLGALLFLAPASSWLAQDANDDEFVFAPLVARRVASRWRGYLGGDRHADPSSAVEPKVYFPRRCPVGKRACAKLIPSFIFAGSERSGSEYVFQTLLQHPQVAMAVGDTEHVFDADTFDESTAFERYLSQFPVLPEDTLAAPAHKRHHIVGELAPHYLYKSHLTARRIREMLPHVKLVFVLRDPIDRAYSQFLDATNQASVSTFESLIDMELPILRRCVQTSLQTGWEGFVRCHQGSEIRASWKLGAENGTHESLTGVLDLLARGMYYSELLPFLQHFPASQLCVMRTEDFLDNPSASFQRLARFLSIDTTFFSERNFYQDQRLTEEVLLGHHPTRPPPRKSVEHKVGGWLSRLRLHHQNSGSGAMRVPAMALEEGPILPLKGLSRDDSHGTDCNTMPGASDASSWKASLATPSDRPSLTLATRYRLQKVFRQLNAHLLELFDEGERYFQGWEYDVDRG